jgi:phosphoribosylglycinamide formyltransferase 1
MASACASGPDADGQRWRAVNPPSSSPDGAGPNAPAGDRPPLQLAVLVSGRGSNLQALIDAIGAGRLDARIVAVLSNRNHAPALRRAEAHGIPSVALDPAGYPDRASYDRALFARLSEFQPNLVVLAGFMRVLDASVVRQWQGRMINVHPSLLPRYPGLHTHRRALQAGDSEHGASVHFVTAEVDGGPVIAQARMAISDDDTAESLASRLLPLEHALLSGVCALMASGRLTHTSAGVKLDGATLVRPLELDAQGCLS